MKSHSCVKTGGGVPSSSEPISQIAATQPLTSQTATTSDPLQILTPCRNIDRLGRRCRLFSTIRDLELCPHHARQTLNRKQRHNDKDAEDLLGGLTDFSTPEAINFLLGNLVRQLARKRIHRRDAMAIAYVCQLLLGSISSMDRHDAALRDSDNAGPGFGPIVFDRPDPLPTDSDPTANPISDSLRVAASFATSRISEPQSTEGRA